MERGGSRAQQALLLRQKMEAQDGDSDDLFGDEGSDGASAEDEPLVVVPDQAPGGGVAEPAEVPKDLANDGQEEVFGNDDSAAESSESAEEEKAAEPGEDAPFNPLLLKPVFIGKQDREIMDPSIQ